MNAPTRGEAMWEYWHRVGQRERLRGEWPQVQAWARPARDETAETKPQVGP